MKNRSENINSQLTYTSFLNRENDFHHLAYDHEMVQYEYLKNANPLAEQVCYQAFHSAELGHLSDNPLRNMQYMFICFVTLATRFLIEGGLNPETAYNISDLYIQKVDRCTSIDMIYELHQQLVAYYLEVMHGIKKASSCSKPIALAKDYIYQHLHETLRLNDLANAVNLNASYLSKLFKQETGQSITGYITEMRIEAAQNMLRYSDYSYVEISNFLAFSSHSYFITVFKSKCGMTPKEYRRKYFRVSF